jgi:type VI secretion system secreted protein VgrG
MELLNAFVNFLVAHRDLVTANRPVRLRLDHPKVMMEDVLLPQRVDGHESLCGGFEYRVLCVALDARLPLKEFIALPAALDIVNDRGKLRTVCGVVTEARAGDSDGGLASYQLVIRDMLAVMEKRINTRVFRNLDEVEILYRLRDEWHHSNPIVGPCFDVITDNIFDDMKYPKREFTMQHNESDAAFIRRILRRRGISWIFEPDVDKHYPSHRMRLLNRFESVRANAAGTVRYHRDAPTEERDSITAWTAVRTLQPMSATRHSWNYKTPLSLDAMQVGMLGQLEQGPVERTLAATLDDYQIWPPHAGDDRKDLTALGELAMDRHDFETKCFMGEGAVRDFRAGEHFTLTGHPEIDRHEAIDREFVITELHLAVQNNLPRDLADRVARLFARSGWGDDDLGARPVRMHFTAVRRGVPIVPAYDPRTDLPPVHMQSALVVGPEKEEVHCDEMGRVKIRFPATREKDHAHASGTGATDTDRDSAWVRVASSWAGNGPGYDQCGALFLPRVGSEVLVAFMGGDPDKPVIVGQMFNQVATPPELSKGNGLPGNRNLSGIRSKEMKGGRRGNQLVFDDTKEQISVQLNSDHGKSQLNLGFLTQVKRNGYAEKRGEGAEVKTADYLALRARKGMLITTFSSGNGEEKQLEREELLSLISEGAGLHADQSEFSEAHGAILSNTEGADELFSTIRDWESAETSMNGGESAYAVSSAGGIAHVTTQTSLNYAGKDSYILAKGEITFSSRGASTWTAKAISLFAMNEDIRLLSHAGKIVVQSQSDSVDIKSSRNVEINSLNGNALVRANEILLVSDSGAFIRIGDDITIGTSGNVNFHGGDFVFGAPKKMEVDSRGMNSRDAAGENGRKIEIELVDADGNVPSDEELLLKFHAADGDTSIRTKQGSATVENAPIGAFLLVQSTRS